jgi:hypothetical protein
MANASKIEQDIARRLGSGDPAASQGRFLVQIFDAGTPTISSRTDDYRVALRRASDEMLGSGGDYAEIFLGSDKVAEAYLQRKNRKYSVKIVGEKPRRR